LFPWRNRRVPGPWKVSRLRDLQGQYRSFVSIRLDLAFLLVMDSTSLYARHPFGSRGPRLRSGGHAGDVRETVVVERAGAVRAGLPLRVIPARFASRHAAAWWLALAAALPACTESHLPGEPEEVLTPEDQVPAPVRAAADRFGQRLGGRCTAWYWDTEDLDWECTFTGLSRRAEMDLGTDGAFHELELVYDFTEVQAVLPDIAAFIAEKCRGGGDAFIELSLRRTALLDEIPDLDAAWKLSGVVLEFQCSNGRDFEIDARSHAVTRSIDDVTDGD